MKSCELGSPVQVKLCAPRVSLGDISSGLKCVADPSSSSLEGEVMENSVGSSASPSLLGSEVDTI